MRRSSKCLLALTAAVATTAAGYAADPTTEQLMQRIEQLQAKVDQLESSQNRLSAKAVDETVERVVRDAEKRSQLLQMEGFTAGYSNGKFLIQDAAGNWVLQPTFDFQLRGVANWRDEGKQPPPPGSSESDWETGFEIRRMKFGFRGNAMSPNLTYYFLWATSTSGSVSPEQEWVRYAFGDEWAIRGGQITNPTFHEQNTSSRRQLTADRSLMNVLLTGASEAFTQGVTLIYDQKGGPLWAEFGVGDGFISGNTDFTDPNEGGTGNFDVFGRVNYFVTGTRGEYDDYTARGNKSDLLVIGGGGDITQGGDINTYMHTVDVQWENTMGLGLYAAYVGNYIDNNDIEETFYNWGGLVQAGYMLNERWEAFGRFDYTSFDSDNPVAVAAGDDKFCEFTVGANWYGSSHNVKFTLDLSVLPSGSPNDQKGLGVLRSEGTEVIARAQFQLLL